MLRALKICLVIIIMLVSTIFTTSILGNSKNNTTLAKSDLPESHLIEGVPYVSQLPAHCFFACMEMVYRYYGIQGINQTEINSLHGVSYNLAYKPSISSVTNRPILKPPYKYSFLSTMASNQGNEDIEFLAGLLGFEVESFYSGHEGLAPRKSWDEYWERLKEEINNDIPLITCVDFIVWRPFTEINDIPNIAALVERGCHSILIVGYNESNQTICFHDSYAGQLNQPEKGTYRWLPLRVFKRAVRRSYWDVEWSNYGFYIIRQVGEPISRDEIFAKCHERNIEKMKGNASAYDEDFIRPNYNIFGIEAWKALRDDYQQYFIRFLPFYRFTNKLNGMPLDYAILAYDFEVFCLNELVDYLTHKVNFLENQSLKDICTFESQLFYNESLKMEKLRNLTIELKEAMNKRFLFRAIQESKPIVDEICMTIDEIIAIQEQIIEGI
jgi:hypothetical protein